MHPPMHTYSKHNILTSITGIKICILKAGLELRFQGVNRPIAKLAKSSTFNVKNFDFFFFLGGEVHFGSLFFRRIHTCNLVSIPETSPLVAPSIYLGLMSAQNHPSPAQINKNIKNNKWMVLHAYL